MHMSVKPIDGYTKIEDVSVKLLEWKFTKKSARNGIYYKGSYTDIDIECSLLGFTNNERTAVIEFNGNEHCINIAYLRDMQKRKFKMDKEC